MDRPGAYRDAYPHVKTRLGCWDERLKKEIDNFKSQIMAYLLGYSHPSAIQIMHIDE